MKSGSISQSLALPSGTAGIVCGLNQNSGKASSDFVESFAGDAGFVDEFVDAAVADTAFASEGYADEFVQDGFYDAAVAADATTQSTSATPAVGMSGWVIGIFVLFSLIVVALIVVIVQVIFILRK